MNGVLDQVRIDCCPLTDRRDSPDETNRSPPVSGSVWDIVAVSSACTWSWGRKLVLPSGCSTGMMARL
ncbi:MAG: hypothetical protein IPI38_00095 [Gemmatimonadetes bacterium]|nr:hypothetical protein [Gemmatimonadota bacterium]